MQFQVGVWKKVYLFYGVFFFGMGLFGFLFSSRLDLSALVHKFFDGFSEELAEVGLVSNPESRVVTGTNRKTPTIVLISRTDNEAAQYEMMVEEIEAKVGERVRFIPYSITGRDWLRSFQMRSLISKGQSFIGFGTIGSAESAESFGMVFTASKRASVQIFDRLINQRPELPLLKLEQVSSQGVVLYGLSFIETEVSTDHWLQVAVILIEELASIPDLRIDHAFQF